MAQVPDLNKVNQAQTQGAHPDLVQKPDEIIEKDRKHELAGRLKDAKGLSKEEKKAQAEALVEYLESSLGVKAPAGSIKSKLSWLRQQSQTQNETKKFISNPDQKLEGMNRKPLEKSIEFGKNFAEHQEKFFEDSAFTFSEFAGTSKKSKEAYGLVRKAQNFWKAEGEFLGELKAAGKSRTNNQELQVALRDLFTLEIQMGSRFDADFANIESGKKDDSGTDDISSAIAEKKSEIKTLHSNLA